MYVCITYLATSTENSRQSIVRNTRDAFKRFCISVCVCVSCFTQQPSNGNTPGTANAQFTPTCIGGVKM